MAVLNNTAGSSWMGQMLGRAAEGGISMGLRLIQIDLSEALPRPPLHTQIGHHENFVVREK